MGLDWTHIHTSPLPMSSLYTPTQRTTYRYVSMTFRIHKKPVLNHFGGALYTMFRVRGGFGHTCTSPLPMSCPYSLAQRNVQTYKNIASWHGVYTVHCKPVGNHFGGGGTLHFRVRDGDIYFSFANELPILICPANYAQVHPVSHGDLTV